MSGLIFRMKKNFFLFILLCWSITLNAEDFIWFDSEGIKFFKIDLDNGNVYHKNLGKIDWEFQHKFKILNKTVVPILRDRQYFNINYGEKLYIFIPGLNFNIEIDFKEKTFLQNIFGKDKGFDFNTFYFQEGKEIYKLGGDGFWNIHSNLYRYSFQEKKWELLQTNGINPFGLNKLFTFIDEKKNKLITVENGAIGLFEPQYHRIFSLDLEKFEWKLEGYITDPRLNSFFTEKTNSKHRKINNKLFLKFQNDEVLIYDFLKNKLFKTNNPKIKSLVLIESYMQSENQISNWYLEGNNPHKIYSNARFHIISDEELLKDSLLMGKAYSNGKMISYYFLEYKTEIQVFLLILLSLVVLSVHLKIKKSKNYSYELDEFEKILNAIIRINKEISSEDLNKLLEIENKSQDTIRQYRAKFYKDFNQYLFKKFKIKDGLERLNDKTDKRYKSYKLKEELITAFNKNKL